MAVFRGRVRQVARAGLARSMNSLSDLQLRQWERQAASRRNRELAAARKGNAFIQALQAKGYLPRKFSARAGHYLKLLREAVNRGNRKQIRVALQNIWSMHEGAVTIPRDAQEMRDVLSLGFTVLKQRRQQAFLRLLERDQKKRLRKTAAAAGYRLKKA